MITSGTKMADRHSKRLAFLNDLDYKLKSLRDVNRIPVRVGPTPAINGHHTELHRYSWVLYASRLLFRDATEGLRSGTIAPVDPGAA